MADTHGVAFELERFGWTAPGRLEVIGRWSGLAGRRLGRPVLTLEAGGRRHRLTALPGGHLAPAEAVEWRAAFAYDGDPEDVTAAELQIGRRLVVDLPRPRRRRRSRSAPSERDRLGAEVAELRAQVAALSATRGAGDAGVAEPPAGAGSEDEADRQARVDAALADRQAREEAEAALADREAELAALRERRRSAERDLSAEVERLRGELSALREEHDRLETEHAQQAEQATEVDAVNERLIAELSELREAVKAAATEHELKGAEAERLRTELAAREQELAVAREELAAAREEASATHTEAERRLEAERAASTEVHERLATAREEAQRTIEAEATETERLRAELQAARDEAERTILAERAETSRLREELAARPAQTNGGDEEGEAEAAARRMYERIARELEQERAAARHLRRELDAVQAQTAEQRRVSSAAVANGITSTEEDAPLAATPAGRLAAARRSDASRAAAHHRAGVARAAAAQRVPEAHPSPVGVWAVRAAAIVLVAGLLVALIIIVTAVA